MRKGFESASKRANSLQGHSAGNMGGGLRQLLAVGESDEYIVKQLQTRASEMTEVYRQLRATGLDIDHEDMRKFKGIANDFMRRGEGSQGHIEVQGAKHILIYKLSGNADVPSTVVLNDTGSW